jgi:AraC-like DNA-binding protein/mannose-6-phosphate isomerase-like protein (cupin superfamily)
MLLFLYSIKLKKNITVIPVAGNYTVIKNSESKAHIHNVYHIMLCTCGEGVLTNDTEEVPLKEGAIVIVSPGERHIMRSVGEGEFVFFSFNFYLYDNEREQDFSVFEDNLSNIEFFEKNSITAPYGDLFPIIIQDGLVQYSKNQWQALHGIVAKIVDYFYNFSIKAPVAKRRLTSLQHDIINFATSRLIELNGIFLQEEQESFSQKDRLIILGIIKFLNRNYNKRFSLNELASELSYSPVYLSRFFKEKTGDTISEYQNRLRISKGCEYLKSTDHKISAIAEMLGFNSSSHFSKNFKKEVGISPREYQKSKGNIS